MSIEFLIVRYCFFSVLQYLLVTGEAEETSCATNYLKILYFKNYSLTYETDQI